MMRLCGGVQDLISGLLTLDPAHRLTAKQALQHPWVRKPHVRPPIIFIYVFMVSPCRNLLTCGRALCWKR